MTALLLCLLAAAPLELKGQAAEGFAYTRFRQAHQLWRAACQAHGVDPQHAETSTWTTSSWQLALALEGHYALPWTTRDIPLTVVQSVRNDGAALWQKVARTHNGKTDHEETALVGDSARYRGYGAGDWQTIAYADDHQDWQSWRRVSHLHEPAMLLRRIATRLHGLQSAGALGAPAHQDVLSFSEENGLVRFLFFNTTTHLLERIETLFHHHGFGDQSDIIQFTDYRNAAGAPRPFQIQERYYQGGSGFSLTWTRDSAATELGQPATHRAVWGELTPTATNEDNAVTWHALGQDVYTVTFAAHEARAFVVAFADHSVVLDAVGDSRAGEQVLDLVDAKLPGKPVTKLVLSHFHPFYTWGVRPYVQRGITIITTPTARPYLQQIVANPHAMLPDQLFLNPKELQLELVEDRLVLEDTHNRLEIYDIGPHTNHTPEYLVSVLPRLKLLVQGDLVWMRPDQARARASSRAKGLLTAIDERGLDIATIGTSIAHEDFLNWVPCSLLREAAQGANTAFDTGAQRGEAITPPNSPWPTTPRSE